MRSTRHALAAAALICIPAGCSQDPAPPTPKTAAVPGQATYERWCSGCHGADPTLAGTHALQQRYQGSVPAVLEDRTDLAPDTIKLIVRNGMNLMPRTRKTEISDAELDAVAAYLTRSKP